MLDRIAADTKPPIAQRDRALQPLTVAEPATLTGAALLAILRRRKLALLLPVLLMPLLTYIALSRITPLYTATGTLLYDPAEYKLRELQSILRVDPITDAVMASQAEVLRGLPVVTQMAARLNLDQNAEFNPALRASPWMARTLTAIQAELFGVSAASVAPLPDTARGALLKRVQDALHVTPVKSSHVLEVSFTAESPAIAAAAVNDAMDIYIKTQLGQKHGAVNRARQWLENRAKELQGQVHEIEGSIANYRRKEGLVEGMHASLDAEQISQLGESLVRAKNDLAEAESKLAAATGRDGTAAQAAIAPSVAQLRTQQAALGVQLQSLLSRLGPNHPEAVSIRQQRAEADAAVAAEIRRVVAASEAEVRADRERVATLEQNLRDAQAHLARDSQAQIPLNAMQRDAEALRSLLQAVLERIQQTAQQAAVETPDAHEISLALPPDEPSAPRTLPWMAAGTASGLLLGLLLVYLRELADDSFHSGDDIRQALGLPCFALLPLVRRRTLGTLRIDEYAARNPRSLFTEQLRALRAGLWLWPDRPRTIAITAARQAEGKTTVALALGRLAAMNGERVVVIDCDIRKPSFDRLLLGEARAGLVDCLQDRASLANVICQDPLSNMAWIPAGKADGDALGLLMSAAMVRLLQSLREAYDLVLLDAPPAQAVTDARIVAACADATLLCVQWRSTPQATVQHAIELLDQAHANVVGAALTQVDMRVHVRSGYADAEVYHPRSGRHFRE